MKKIVPSLLLLVILFACNQQKTGEATGNQDSLDLIPIKADSANIQTDTHYFWAAEPDSKSIKVLMKRTRPLAADSLTAGYLIGLVNDKYPAIKLDFIKISADTIFVKIKKSNVLTQQMGSSGADMYMTETTYNLTELKNINYVDFNFTEGDHASPGTYSRSSFINVKDDTE